MFTFLSNEVEKADLHLHNIVSLSIFPYATSELLQTTHYSVTFSLHFRLSSTTQESYVHMHFSSQNPESLKAFQLNISASEHIWSSISATIQRTDEGHAKNSQRTLPPIFIYLFGHVTLTRNTSLTELSESVGVKWNSVYELNGTLH